MAMITAIVPVSRMDWCAWLSKTPLDPATAYECGLLFAQNELEEDDIPHFDHEFLISMGVTVAKHRLEILKLAKKERRRQRWQQPRPVATLLAAADRTRRCLAWCLQSLAAGIGRGSGAGSSALVAVRNPRGRQWGSALMKGRSKLAGLQQGRLMLADGGARAAATVQPPARYGRASRSKGAGDGKFRGGGGKAGEVRWDSMFQDLKPT